MMIKTRNRTDIVNKDKKRLINNININLVIGE